MKYVAVIPARGGSKGVKDKNLQLVGEHSLITRAILGAKKVDKVDRIIVSTDSEKIATEALKYGAEVHRRTERSASDSAKTIELMTEIHGDYGFSDEVCVLLQPTSPLRTDVHIAESIKTYETHNKLGSVVTVTECDHHPYKSVILETDGFYKPVHNVSDFEAPRQSLPKAFRVNGAVYVIAFKELLKNRSFFTNSQYFVQMSEECSIDIDTYDDLNRANFLLSKES